MSKNNNKLKKKGLMLILKIPLDVSYETLFQCNLHEILINTTHKQINYPSMKISANKNCMFSK